MKLYRIERTYPFEVQVIEVHQNEVKQRIEDSKGLDYCLFDDKQDALRYINCAKSTYIRKIEEEVSWNEEIVNLEGDDWIVENTFLRTAYYFEITCEFITELLNQYNFVMCHVEGFGVYESVRITEVIDDVIVVQLSEYSGTKELKVSINDINTIRCFYK